MTKKAQKSYIDNFMQRDFQRSFAGLLIILFALSVMTLMNAVAWKNNDFFFIASLIISCIFFGLFVYAYYLFITKFNYSKNIYFFFDAVGYFCWHNTRPSAMVQGPIIEVTSNFFSLRAKLISGNKTDETSWVLRETGVKFSRQFKSLTLTLVSPKDKHGFVQIVQLSPFDALSVLRTSNNFSELISKK